MCGLNFLNYNMGNGFVYIQASLSLDINLHQATEVISFAIK